MSLTGISGAPIYGGNQIPITYSNQILVKYYPRLILNHIANKDYEGQLKKHGQEVVIRQRPDVTIVDLARYQTLSHEKVTAAPISLTVDYNFGSSVELDSVDDFMMDIDYQGEIASETTEQLAIKQETIILNGAYTDAASTNQGATAGAVSGNINLGTTGAPVEVTTDNVVEVIERAARSLNENNNPGMGRWIVLPSFFSSKMLGSVLKAANVMGDNSSIIKDSAKHGLYGSYLGFDIYISNVLNPIVDGGKNAYHCLFGTKAGLSCADLILEHRICEGDKDSWSKFIQSRLIFGYKGVKDTALGTLYAYEGVG